MHVNIEFDNGGMHNYCKESQHISQYHSYKLVQAIADTDHQTDIILDLPVQFMPSPVNPG